MLALLIGALLMATTLPAVSSTTIILSGPDIGIRMVENQELLTDAPNLLAQTMTSAGERLYLCTTLSDETCTAASNIRATSFLPPCSSEITINCISSLYAVASDGSKLQGTFQRFVAEGTEREYVAASQINLPQGKGQGGLWRIPGLINGAGNDKYYVGARFDLWASVRDGKVSNTFIPGRMVTGIFPVSEKAGAFALTVSSDSTNPSSDGSPNGGVGSGNLSQDASWIDCVVTETGNCLMAANFPDEYRFGLTLRLGSALKGWFHGRIYQPVITTNSIGGAGQEITIEALPVVVPTIQEKVPTSAIPQELRDYLATHSVSNGFGYVMPESSQPDSYVHTKMWLPVIKDKASKSMTYWSVRTLDQISDPIIQQCTQNYGALSGIVTTNSLVYNAGPPDFDKSSQNLNYKVLSTHFNADGTVAKGTYDLILSSSVARCIYGFTKAPIKADLTILSEDGSPQIATQTISERNGWLTLSAAGFSYSSPTIKVILTQEAPTPVATPTPAASSQPSKVKPLTITCAKGKNKKKVTSVNPKCPTGYKKVA